MKRNYAAGGELILMRRGFPLSVQTEALRAMILSCEIYAWIAANEK